MGTRAFMWYNYAMSLPSPTAVTLRFDGACAPNPGPMGIGYELSIQEPGDPRVSRVLAYGGFQLGRGTNNVAEYRALIAGLQHAIRLGFWTVGIVSDSLLVVNQLRRVWKVKKGRLRMLHTEAKILLDSLAGWAIMHVPREENERADELSHSVCLSEPSLPPKPWGGNARQAAALYPWQAAFVRHQWQRGVRNEYLWARVFQVKRSVIRQIGVGVSYRTADFSTLPAPESFNQPEPPESLCADCAPPIAFEANDTSSEREHGYAQVSPGIPTHPHISDAPSELVVAR